MNASDREALAAIAEQLRALSALATKLEYLSDKETVKALEGLVEAAPALKKVADKAESLVDLADGYRLAGTAGNIVKWTASVAAGVGALWAFVKFVIFGDPK